MVGAARAVEVLGVIDQAFWSGRRILLTGHTGFKGAWLALWLARLGARVTAFALAPSGDGNLHDVADVAACVEGHLLDLRDGAGVAALVRHAQPEVVLHLAAQSLVRAGYAEPLSTLATNLMGTAHLLDALRRCDAVRVVVVVTTDKVYANREWDHPYREGDALGGADPYSASKATCEIVTACWRDAFLAARGVAVATARAGNVIGGGDRAVDRLLPDAVRAWTAGRPVELRRPLATRPWQHVLDPLAGYLVLVQRLWQEQGLAGAWNFGPTGQDEISTLGLVERAAAHWPGARWQALQDVVGPHEAGRLALDSSAARARLGWRPRWTIDDAVRRTVTWYVQAGRGVPAAALCEADFAAFEAAA